MRNSSYNHNDKENFQQPKHIRGGDKKVMKKSLKVIASAAVALSMFATSAMAADTTTTTTTTTDAAATAAKTSKDFKDLEGKDAALLAKIDALLKAGIFEGDSEDSFGIDKPMTRGQFAKILVNVYGVEVDANVKTSSFADVAADHWALSFIEAAKKAGYLDGKSDTSFDPDANVTIGELATGLLKGLKIKPSTSGNPWYADAVKQAIEKGVLAADADGGKVASRSDLVTASYGAKEAFDNANQPAKVSVKEVKPIGVKKVQVTLDRDVDTAKATLTLKRGSSEIKTTTKFEDNKRVAVLELTDVKISAGDYTVTLAGLDASEIENATGSFTGENEVVKKIEFTNASDTIAWSSKVRVPFQATNQYGERSSLTSGGFSVFATTGSPQIKTTSTGDTFVELSTKNGDIAQGQSQVSININDSNYNVQAQKIFKIGNAPYISKIELKEPEYQNGATALNKEGDTAKVTLVEYDQYGCVIVKGMDTVNTPSAYISPNPTIFEDIKDSNWEWNSDDMRVAIVKLKKKPEGNAEAILNVYGASTTATTKIKLSAAKVASKVEIEGNTFAEGDTDQYVTINAYDANGDKLSVDDIVQNAKDGRFDNINITGALVGVKGSVGGVLKEGYIVKAGEHKGKIHISSVTKGTGFIYINLFNTFGGNSTTASQTFNVSSPRYASSIKLASDMPSKVVDGVGAIEAKGKVYVYDQNNAQFKKKADYTYSETNGATVSNDVYVTITGKTEAFDVAIGDTALSNGQSIKDFSLVNDKDFKITLKAGAPVAANDYVEVKLFVRKLASDGTVKDSSVSSFTKRITVIDPAKETLNYSVEALNNAFAAIDDKTYEGGDFDNAALSKQHKEVKLIAKDNGGNKVAIDAVNMIQSVTSSVYTVARAAQLNDVASSDNKKWYVLGNKAGTATVSVDFINAKGESGRVSSDITVKTDAVVVDTITADKKSRDDKTLTEIKAMKAPEVMDLKVVDNYGIEYKTTNINKYDLHLGVRYGVSDVQTTDKAAGTVSISPDGTFTLSDNIESFVITATTANGKSATTAVIVKK
ncbi:S-layer homology domain-containing protein [Paenibacillus chartarius]|uniref:S-layer homology domain-containing protein n=1 Tax=Paenibacillus chartarius TaxID=747481 RepID=A0ABV6DJZ5_9BACL